MKIAKNSPSQGKKGKEFTPCGWKFQKIHAGRNKIEKNSPLKKKLQWINPKKWKKKEFTVKMKKMQKTQA